MKLYDLCNMNPEEYDDKPAYRLAVAKRLMNEVDVNVQCKWGNPHMGRPIFFLLSLGRFNGIMYLCREEALKE